MMTRQAVQWSFIVVPFAKRVMNEYVVVFPGVIGCIED